MNRVCGDYHLSRERYVIEFFESLTTLQILGRAHLFDSFGSSVNGVGRLPWVYVLAKYAAKDISKVVTRPVRSNNL